MLPSFRLPVSHAEGCMPAIVAIPNVVEELVMQFGLLYKNGDSVPNESGSHHNAVKVVA